MTQQNAVPLRTPSGREIHAVIFDMDGTIFDSERLWLHTWKLAEKEFGFTGSEAMFLKLAGSNRPAIEAYIEFFGGDEELAQRVLQFRTDLAKKLWTRPVGPLKPGAGELLTALWRLGVPTALATASPQSQADTLFGDAHLPMEFQVVLSGDQGLPSKPAPDIFLRAADRLGVPIGDCAVIEDSQNGILAAVASGAYAVLIPDIVPPVPQVREQAHAVLKDMWELADHLGVPVAG